MARRMGATLPRWLRMARKLSRTCSSRQERAVHQAKLVADELGQVRVQAQPALLGVEEHAHQAARLVAEDAVGGGVDFTVDELEAVHGLVGGLAAPPGSKAESLPGQRQADEAAGRRQQRQPLLEGARDQVDIARVAVDVAHEAFDALAGGAFAVAEVVGDGGLEVLAQHVHGAVGVVMHLRADTQQEVVGGFQLLALALADEVVCLQVLERAGAVLEEGHPEQVLVVAQAAAAVLEVGLLHGGRVAELGAPRGLVVDAHGDVFRLMALDTLC